MWENMDRMISRKSSFQIVIIYSCATKPWGFDIVESRNLFKRFVFLFSKVETVERFRRCRNIETLSKPLANQNRFRNHMFRFSNYFPPKPIKKNKKPLTLKPGMYVIKKTFR